MAERKTVAKARATLNFWIHNLQENADTYWERSRDESRTDGQPSQFWVICAKQCERERDAYGSVLELLP